jgi:hypothetical protein
MAFTAEEISFFKLSLLDKLLTRADRVIRPQIPSRRLRQAMVKTFDISKPRRAIGGLFITHFWAVMLHDGHRSFGPKNAKFLVYFVNEDDDPRKPTPRRAADVRRLTRGEFNDGLERNRSMQIQNPSGGSMQHMIIVKTPSGRAARVGASPATNFFSEGGKSFEKTADDLIFAEFDAFVKKNTPHDAQHIRFVI